MAPDGCEQVKPYSPEGEKRTQVEQMFDHIAPAYDRLNHILSLGIDRLWRRRAVRELSKQHPQHILDIATGTGDFALLCASRLRPAEVVATDISEGMMQLGRQKATCAGLDGVIRFQTEDCTRLSFAAGSFDAVTCAFGVRNFQDLPTALAEMQRVLRPGGQAVILELSTPPRFPMRQLFWVYSHWLMPLVGSLLSRDRKAYDYLTRSIEAFPQAETMEQTLRQAGFARVEWHRLTMGICTLYVGTSPNPSQGGE